MVMTTFELDGLTSFRSRPKSTYRFMLPLKSKKLNVWIEDRKSKKQWQSGFLGLDQFVSSDNAIPGAKLGEYAMCFKAALEGTDGESTAPVERELIDADGGLTLKFVVHINVFSSSWSPAYSLALKPVAIERIDIAESRLFDVEQEMERIASGRMPSPTVAHLEVAAASGVSQEASWSPVSSKMIAVDNGTEVRALVDGVFLVAMNISSVTDGRNNWIQLLKNGQEVFRCTVPYCSGQHGHPSVSWIVELKTRDTLSLIGQGFSVQVGSKMAITKIGG